MAGLVAEVLGVDVEPGAVGGLLGPVDRLAAGFGVGGIAAAGGDEGESTNGGHVAGRSVHEAKVLPSGLTPCRKWYRLESCVTGVAVPPSIGAT